MGRTLPSPTVLLTDIVSMARLGYKAVWQNRLFYGDATDRYKIGTVAITMAHVFDWYKEDLSSRHAGVVFVDTSTSRLIRLDMCVCVCVELRSTLNDGALLSLLRRFVVLTFDARLI